MCSPFQHSCGREFVDVVMELTAQSSCTKRKINMHATPYTCVSSHISRDCRLFPEFVKLTDDLSLLARRSSPYYIPFWLR